jgi:hypothetical protein
MTNLEIPTNLRGERADDIDFSLISGKSIVGLCGYAKSGKDTIGKVLAESHGFTRVSFGDVLKSDLNEHMKMGVMKDLIDNGVHNVIWEDIDFLNPRTGEIKEMLRPYMIWFGEIMKKRNGIHYWTNRAFSKLNEWEKNIVITDVRRINELELFKNSDNFKKRLEENFNASGISRLDYCYDENKIAQKTFKSLLIHVNQLGLSDGDVLTHDTIRVGAEQWLFDHTVFIDSRIPDEREWRKKHINWIISGINNKFPDYFL